MLTVAILRRRRVSRLTILPVVLLLSVASVSQAIGYTFLTLTVNFPSFKEQLFGCAATAINDTGLVVGGCNDLVQNSEFVGFLYDGVRFTEMGFKHTKPAALADPDLQNPNLLFARSAYQGMPFRNRASGPLPALSRDPVFSGITPQDINNQGDITGWFFDGRLRGFIKRNGNGNVVVLDVPGSLLTEATGLNDLDEAVGDFRGEDGLFHGFIYRNGSFASIDHPSGGDTGASGINNRGQIVGCYASCSRGFLHDSDTSAFTPIDIPGAITTQAADINDLGQIVGNYSRDNATVHGFVYDGGRFTFIDVPGAVMTSITGINNAGQISGYYVLEASPGVFEHHAYLARPE